MSETNGNHAASEEPIVTLGIDQHKGIGVVYLNLPGLEPYGLRSEDAVLIGQELRRCAAQTDCDAGLFRYLRRNGADPLHAITMVRGAVDERTGIANGGPPPSGLIAP